FVAAHSQYQNLLTLAELFLVGLITSVARIRSGGLLLPVLLHMGEPAEFGKNRTLRFSGHP
ncbi:CPBP family glutamic-type intramembrane protease, partial [Escherichia coli]